MPNQTTEQPTIDNTGLTSQHAAVFVALSKLPAFHATALKLMNISVDTQSAMKDFENAFKADPALTADLLLVANSAAFGLRTRVETIRHALTYLGLERVRSLGCSIAFSFYVRNVPRTEYMRQVWRHSIATAVIAEELGKLHGNPALYTPGLLHDLGRMALFLSVGQEYADKLSFQFDNIEQSSELEKHLFGMTHCEAGFMVAQKWNFPVSLLNCMSSHHNKLDPAEMGLPGLVQIACHLADSLGFPEVSRTDPPAAGVLPAKLKNCPELRPERLFPSIEKQISAMAG